MNLSPLKSIANSAKAGKQARQNLFELWQNLLPTDDRNGPLSLDATYPL